jgi:hypothetical protein
LPREPVGRVATDPNTSANGGRPRSRRHPAALVFAGERTLASILEPQKASDSHNEHT